MAVFQIDAPNGKSYTIEGEDAQGALAALRKHIGDAGPPQQSASDEPADHGLSQRQQLSPVEKALNPITSYPETYQRMNKDARDQISRGVGQITNPNSGAVDVAKGVGNTALGTLGYVASPINAAYRSIIGQPVEDVTGIPREYTEFAAQLATPGIGLTGRAPTPAPSLKPVPSAGELKAAYTDVRNSRAVTDAPVPMQDIAALSARAQDELTRAGFRPTKTSAGDTFRELGNLTPKAPEITPAQRLQAEMNWEPLPRGPQATQATVDDVLAARRAFGQTAQQRQPFPQMGATPDAAASQRVMSKIDDLIEQNAPEMIDANKNYSAAKASEAIDARVQKAELSAAANNSGMNIGNKIRQQAAQILGNPAARRGLQEEEISMLDSLARGNNTRNALRWWSNVFGGGGGLGAEVTGDIASRTLGPVGWLLSPVGSALKHVENHLTVNAADKVSEAIRARSPLGKAIESSSVKWNTARDALMESPTPQKFAAFSMASRNLSNTLTGAGAKVDPSAFLKSLQGPIPARGQDEQQ